MSIEEIIKKMVSYKVNIEGKSPKSMKLYEDAIKEYCKDMNLKTLDDLTSSTSQTMQEWIIKLCDKNNSSTTRNKKLIMVKQLYWYLLKVLKVNIDLDIISIKLAKTKKKETKYLNENLMNEFIRKTRNLRTKACVVVLLNTGLRFSEMMQLTVDDIKNGTALVNGKGNKERRIYFPKDTLVIVNRYIDKKRKRILEKTGKETNLLFISDNGNPLDKSNFTNSLKYYANKIGLTWANEMSPHKLRHSYITKMANRGTPIHILKSIAGHSNISTTNLYLHNDENEVRRVMLGGTGIYNIENADYYDDDEEE